MPIPARGSPSEPAPTLGTLLEKCDLSDNGLMRRFLVALLALGFLSLTSCSSGPAVQTETLDGHLLAKATGAWPDTLQAIISGRLSTLEGGCIGLSGGGVGHVAVFPAGTTLLSSGVEIPGLGKFDFGNLISAQGGLVPSGDWADSLPDECPSDQVYVFT